MENRAELPPERKVSPANYQLANDLIVFIGRDLKPSARQPFVTIENRPHLLVSHYPPEKVKDPSRSFQTKWLQTLPPNTERNPAKIRRARVIYLWEEGADRIMVDVIGSYSSRLIEFSFIPTEDSKFELEARQWYEGKPSPLGGDHHALLAEVFNCLRDELGKTSQWDGYQTPRTESV